MHQPDSFGKMGLLVYNTVDLHYGYTSQNLEAVLRILILETNKVL